MTEQFSQLVSLAEQITWNLDWEHNDSLVAQARTLTSRLVAAVERLSPPGSPYVRELEIYRDQPHTYRFRGVLGIASGLRDDLQAGMVQSVAELVHADTHSDYLGMAEELLGKNYKDAAAVIAGTALEVHIRALCVKSDVDVALPSGSPKKADTMNADLKKEGVYDGLRQKQLTAWMDLRNKAAHGNYDEYDRQQVRHLIDGVRDFMIKYPA